MKTSFGGMKRKHWCLTEQTKVNIDLLKNALQNRYHIQGRLYDMSAKLHKLKQGSSLEAYINNPDNLARHLQLPEQQKIHYFIFGLKPKLKQTLLIRQPQTYNNTDSDTQLMDLLQEIQKEVSLKHPGIKHELYSVHVQDGNTNRLQQDIPQLQSDTQILKESVTTSTHQHATPSDTNHTTSSNSSLAQSCHLRSMSLCYER